MCCTFKSAPCCVKLLLALQVREHILRTQCTEISWQDLCKICSGTSNDEIKHMVSEYESYNLWSVEHDDGGQIRLLVAELG
jgi:recombinational DNA repair protein RecR